MLYDDDDDDDDYDADGGGGGDRETLSLKCGCNSHILETYFFCTKCKFPAFREQRSDHS